MGYSRKADVLAKVKDFLDQMSASQETLTWTTQDSHKLAYQLREALSYAASQPDSPYHNLKEKFLIRAKPQVVIAEPRIAAPIAVLQKTLTKMVINDALDLYGVVGAAIKHKGQELFFHNTSLSVDELKKLYMWTSTNGYHIVHSDEGVSLTQSDPGDLAWKPKI